MEHGRLDMKGQHVACLRNHEETRLAGTPEQDQSGRRWETGAGGVGFGTDAKQSISHCRDLSTECHDGSTCFHG